MANAVYPTYKTSILIADTNVALNNNTAPDQPFVSLNTGAYNSAHQFYSSMSGTNVGTEQNIGTPTVTAGTFDGNDVTFTAVTGSTVTALVFYRHNSGANTTWRLFLFLDTSVTNLPVVPNGGNISITWNASGIFTISDKVVKRDIKRVCNIGPLSLYEYRYVWGEGRQTGVMAQDVAKVWPDAVADLGGVLAVNYPAILARI